MVLRRPSLNQGNTEQTRFRVESSDRAPIVGQLFATSTHLSPRIAYRSISRASPRAILSNETIEISLPTLVGIEEKTEIIDRFSLFYILRVSIDIRYALFHTTLFFL